MVPGSPFIDTHILAAQCQRGDCWPGWGGPSTSVLTREAHPELHPHPALGTRADVGGGPGGSSLSPRMRTPFNRRREPQTRAGALISEQTLVEVKKKKKVAECGSWQEHPRAQMYVPACPRCSLCLPPSGLLRPVLAWILPADSREATGHQGQVAVEGGEPGDNSGKGHPFLEGNRFSVPKNKR